MFIGCESSKVRTPLGVHLLITAMSIYENETLGGRSRRKKRCYDRNVLQVAKAVYAMVHYCPFRSLVSGSASIPVVT
jgi:hypothetical protein